MHTCKISIQVYHWVSDTVFWEYMVSASHITKFSIMSIKKDLSFSLSKILESLVCKSNYKTF